MWQYIEWMRTDQERMQQLLQETDALNLRIPRPDEVPLPKLDTHEPPDNSASIEVWLDWRDEEIRRGRKVSLPRIAALSNHSLSTIKKRNADRNRKEPQ
jgi:hypothetical protein